ncbi:MAG: response regulator [Bryocella sp.]
MPEQNVVDSPSEQFDGGDFENDFENNDSDSGDGSQPAPGTGQSKSSRRRRRKRKNKVATPATPGQSIVLEGGADFAEGAAPAPFVMEGETIAAAATTSAPRRSRARQTDAQQSAPQQAAPQQSGQQQSGSQPNSQQPQGGQATGKRWKKKFRDRDRDRRPPQRNENPGNDFRADSSSNNGGGYSNSGGYRPDNFGNTTGGFKRKGKGGGQQQRRDRGFVGPMDHSYREAEGESAPPSTISLQNSGRRGGHRHHGDNQPIDHNMPRAIPIPENAQTRIYFFIEELFFQAKIQESARKLGVKVAFLKGDNKEAMAELVSGEDHDRPALIVFDLNNANAKPLTLIPKLKAKLKKSVSIIGFLSHLQGDLKAKASEAGCDTVMPRSAFSQNLPNLLRRYGVEEVEEVNYNR